MELNKKAEIDLITDKNMKESYNWMVEEILKVIEITMNKHTPIKWTI